MPYIVTEITCAEPGCGSTAKVELSSTAGLVIGRYCRKHGTAQLYRRTTEEAKAQRAEESTL